MKAKKSECCVTVTRQVSWRYLLYLPDGYSEKADARFPMILFLHGAGERGTDVRKVAVNGIPRRLEQGFKLPAIVVAPQCPAGEWWEPDSLLAFLDRMQTGLRVDASRIYVTGLSMGGHGTWTLVNRAPERFAAAVPVCAPKAFVDAARFRHVPIWCFHGALDSVVPLADSALMVRRLREAGADVKFTVYPDADHDSWTPAYSDRALYEWLFKQKRPRSRAARGQDSSRATSA